jgi:hypothetical protein
MGLPSFGQRYVKAEAAHAADEVPLGVACEYPVAGYHAAEFVDESWTSLKQDGRAHDDYESL